MNRLTWSALSSLLSFSALLLPVLFLSPGSYAGTPPNAALFEETDRGSRSPAVIDVGVEDDGNDVDVSDTDAGIEPLAQAPEGSVILKNDEEFEASSEPVFADESTPLSGEDEAPAVAVLSYPGN